MANYYYLAGETPTGPFNLVEMEVLSRNKQITAETLICREGGQEWTPVAAYPELVAMLPSQTPPVVLPVEEMETSSEPKHFSEVPAYNLKRCPDCGTMLAESASVCPKCGRRFSTPTSIIMAIIIGLILGGCSLVMFH
jgi:rRNA maturation protein Nop10